MGRYIFLVAIVACGGATSDPHGDGAVTDAGNVEATEDVDASDADVDPLAPCNTGERDVFYVDIAGSGIGYLAGMTKETNLDTTWSLTYPDLEILISSGATSDTFELYTSNEQPVSPGIYSDDSPTGPWPGVALNGIACAITGGDVTVDDIAFHVSDAGTDIVDSVLLSFDGQCSADFSIRGCIRYASSP